MRQRFAQEPLPPHFFGAIVLDPIEHVGAGGVDRRQVIDGQQRLTDAPTPHLAAVFQQSSMAKHMLGNLKLLTEKRLLKQSNQAWEDKRERLQRHSLLLLNKRLLELRVQAVWPTRSTTEASFVNSMQGVADSSERLGQVHRTFRSAARSEPG